MIYTAKLVREPRPPEPPTPPDDIGYAAFGADVALALRQLARELVPESGQRHSMETP